MEVDILYGVKYSATYDNRNVSGYSNFDTFEEAVEYSKRIYSRAIKEPGFQVTDLEIDKLITETHFDLTEDESMQLDILEMNTNSYRYLYEDYIRLQGKLAQARQETIQIELESSKLKGMLNDAGLENYNQKIKAKKDVEDEIGTKIYQKLQQIKDLNYE